MATRITFRILACFFLSLSLCQAALSETTATAETKFSATELERLAAPVALYPDVLLAQVLPASAYPLEVVQAARWLKGNQALKESSPETFEKKLAEKEWDASIKAIVGVPEVLAKLDGDLDWTTKLGDAFVNQQEDLMAAVQRLRQQAKEAGSLQTTEQQIVIVEKEVIRIEPAQPTVIYVPTYNPAVVYYPSSTTVYRGYSSSDVAAASLLSFGLGVAVGNAWKNDCDWYSRNVYVHHHGYPYRRRHYYHHGNVHHRRADYRNERYDRRSDYRKERYNHRNDAREKWQPTRERRQQSLESRSSASRSKAASREWSSRSAHSRNEYRGWDSSKAQAQRTQRTENRSANSAQRRQSAQAYRSQARSKSTFSGYNNRQTTQAYSNRGRSSRDYSRARGNYHSSRARAHSARGSRGGGRGGRR